MGMPEKKLKSVFVKPKSKKIVLNKNLEVNLLRDNFARNFYATIKEKICYRQNKFCAVLVTEVCVNGATFCL